MEPSRWLGPPSEIAPLDVARSFGQKVAEKPIQDDMRADPDLGNPRDQGLFVDTSVMDTDDNMIIWMGLRGNLPPDRVKAMRDYRHRQGTYAGRPIEWARPDAVCHTTSAREYYEIKPLSDPGITNANSKFAKIDQFIATFKLPYTRGEKYMADGKRRRKEIVSDNPEFLLMRNNLLGMFKLKNIRIFVTWERPVKAMIIYALEVEVETDDKRNQETAAMRNLARFAAQLAIRAVVPEAASLVPPPQGVIRVELPPELADFKDPITASAGRMVFDAVPGETHLLVIEEEGFQRIIERQRRLPPLLRSAGSMFITEEWRRVLRESAADQARLRDQAILIIGLMLLSGVALYVCLPLFAAGGATITVAGAGTAATTGGEAAALGVEGQQVMRIGTTALQTLLRSPAANDNAVRLAKAAGFALIPTFVFGNVNDAAAAESLALKGTASVSSINFDVTWLLRPNKISGTGPAQFGDVFDVSSFGLVRFARPGDPQPSSKMRLIGRVRFI